MRDKLEKKVENLQNYVFFSARNGKAHSLKSFIENYFLKRGSEVNCNITPRSVDIKFKNPNKNASWEYTTSRLWLEDIEKQRSFSDCYSNFAFEIGSHSVRDYFPRPPKAVKSFWQDLEELIDSGLLDKEVLELNYPFQLSKSPTFDSSSLVRNIDENMIVALDSGKINAKRNVVHLIENILLKDGYEVEVFLKKEHLVIEFTNTKKGQWKKCECVILFETEHKEPTWDKHIDYTYRKLKSISVIQPKEKINKHYSNFFDFVSTQEFFENVEDTIALLDYPFSHDRFLSC